MLASKGVVVNAIRSSSRSHRPLRRELGDVLRALRLHWKKFLEVGAYNLRRKRKPFDMSLFLVPCACHAFAPQTRARANSVRIEVSTLVRVFRKVLISDPSRTALRRDVNNFLRSLRKLERIGHSTARNAIERSGSLVSATRPGRFG